MPPQIEDWSGAVPMPSSDIRSTRPYVLLQLGYLLQSISVRNALVMLFASGCNVGRALAEERLLTHNGSYEAYRAEVRWRLLPGVW